jgi:3-oxoacyl-[acyl-carrier protein] reductase
MDIKQMFQNTPKLLEGRVAIITGSARGTGAATAIRMAVSGAAVVINYRSNDIEAKEIEDKILSFGGKAITVRANVADEEEAKALYEAAINAFSRVDILVNNAWPGFVAGTVTDVEWEEYTNYIDVMVKGAFLISKAVLPEMISQKYGRIINIGTTALWALNEAHSGYNTSKAALWGLTNSIAVDYGKFGITANMVTPGLIWTDLQNPQPGDFGPEHRARTPMGRNANASDVAGAVLFFASDLAEFVTGTNLPVCGGFILS